MNWGNGSNHYENFTKLIITALMHEKILSKLVLKIVEAEIADIAQSGEVGKAIANEEKPRADALSGNLFVKTEVEKSHQRLGALIAFWYERSQEPLPYHNASN